MQPIYDLDQSVRDDVAKLRAEKRVKPDTGGRWGGSGIGASPAAGSLARAADWQSMPHLVLAGSPPERRATLACAVIHALLPGQRPGVDPARPGLACLCTESSTLGTPPHRLVCCPIGCPQPSTAWCSALRAASCARSAGMRAQLLSLLRPELAAHRLSHPAMLWPLAATAA